MKIKRGKPIPQEAGHCNNTLKQVKEIYLQVNSGTWMPIGYKARLKYNDDRLLMYLDRDDSKKTFWDGG